LRNAASNNDDYDDVIGDVVTVDKLAVYVYLTALEHTTLGGEAIKEFVQPY